MTLYLNTELT